MIAVARATVDVSVQDSDSFVGGLESSLHSLGVTADSDEYQQLFAAVFRPLLPFIGDYQQYQQSALLEKLNVWNFVSLLNFALDNGVLC